MMQFWVSVWLVLLALYAGLAVLLVYAGRQVVVPRRGWLLRLAWAGWGLGVADCLLFLAVWLA